MGIAQYAGNHFCHRDSDGKLSARQQQRSRPSTTTVSGLSVTAGDNNNDGGMDVFCR